MRTHSVYEREIQDLPVQEKKVILLVTTRKMFCDNPQCQHTTFAEVHPFAAPKAQKTDRLVKNILHTSAQLSVSASKNDVVQSSRFSAILTTSLFEALRIFMF
ncbi:MAG: transposase family protein, partial [Lachnospiraceae bacterium]|nr:transposase family protein [Lachnospiraceae bacterium]